MAARPPPLEFKTSRMRGRQLGHTTPENLRSSPLSSALAHQCPTHASSP
eukprot:CAMPEP_0184726056 /NCGR_PEP_ID=MMETSP0314-20130426/32674_1 /TAXON_ID=38298 /ORGANISM="Rhodella maculata, Strain CCMP 736" /LENGTH=48 /DNA_ID= /DNA_START= /DNA_END= /DNA_ORIENTATION=